MQHDVSLNRVMEADTIQKNGASLKSYTSKKNFKIMLQNFKKQQFYLLAIAASLTMIFTSCSKDDDNGSETGEYATINATVVNGNDYNATVTRVNAITSSGRFTIASGNYENGGFKIDLPATIPDNYLDEFDDLASTLKISDPKAKSTLVFMIAYDKAGNEAGGFELFDKGPNNNADYVCDYFYADRDFTLRGTDEDGAKYDCSFKKGWNMLYTIRVAPNQGYATTKPKDINFKWFYETEY